MIIAAILLVIGVAGALGAIGASTRTASYASQIQTAALLAQRQLAETASQPDSLSSGGDQEGSFDEPYSSYHWKQSVESTDYTKLFKVTVTVTWGSGANPEHDQPADPAELSELSDESGRLVGWHHDRRREWSIINCVSRPIGAEADCPGIRASLCSKPLSPS